MARRSIIVGLIALPALLLLVAGVAVVWRKPLAEAAASYYVERTYGVPATITISRLDASSARIDHVKIGEQAPFEASDIRLDYDLGGHIAAIVVGSASAHARIEGGPVTRGDLEPLIASGGDTSRKSETKLPDAISVDHLDLALDTPMG